MFLNACGEKIMTNTSEIKGACKSGQPLLLYIANYNANPLNTVQYRRFLQYLRSLVETGTRPMCSRLRPYQHPSLLQLTHNQTQYSRREQTVHREIEMLKMVTVGIEV